METLGDILKRIRHWVRPWEMGTEPMEVRRAVLEEIDGRVVAAGGGRRIFPYNHVHVLLLVGGPEERSMLEGVVREGWDLEGEVRRRMREQGAELPPGFTLDIGYTEEAGPEFGGRHYRVTFERTEEEPAPADAGERPILELTVTKGKATRQVYDFTAERIYLGRMEEVIDGEGRVRRRNDVAFLEEGEVNQTVSREQARIAWDDQTRGYWLRAEPGASATRIFRDGRAIEVSRQDRRGVRLQPGDEVYLGRACLKVGLRNP
jgi:hypothetical protein